MSALTTHDVCPRAMSREDSIRQLVHVAGASPAEASAALDAHGLLPLAMAALQAARANDPRSDRERLEDGLLGDLLAETAPQDFGMTPEAVAEWAAQLRAQQAERAARAALATNGHWDRMAAALAADEASSGRRPEAP